MPVLARYRWGVLARWVVTMTSKSQTSNRAVAPVVGIALLIMITVILAAVVGSVVLGIGVGTADAPQATLSFSPVDETTVDVVHESGERLPAEEIVVRTSGGEEIHTMSEDLSAGQRESVDIEGVSEDERINVVWRHPDGDSETVLATHRP